MTLSVTQRLATESVALRDSEAPTYNHTNPTGLRTVLLAELKVRPDLTKSAGRDSYYTGRPQTLIKKKL